MIQTQFAEKIDKSKLLQLVLDGECFHLANIRNILFEPCRSGQSATTAVSSMMMFPIANCRLPSVTKPDPICCDHVSLEGLRTGTLRVAETTSKASAPALFLSIPFCYTQHTWTLSTEVRFAVPLNCGSLVNDWPTWIESARTTGWRPHSECGHRSPS